MERVLGVMRIVEHASANAQDHRSVPLDQSLEGWIDRLARPGRELVEQLTIGKPPDDANVPERL